MAESAIALWLDTNLAGFDHLFLSIQHFFADHAGAVLTPLMRAITFVGEKGIIFFLLALVFMLTASRRDLGVCIFGAVCCGALITNIILKDSVARLRPFENDVEYELWWMVVGSPSEDGYSFPSGHVTACAAGMTAIMLMRGKKWILPSAITVALMCISRNYLMAHYPSDVLVAAVIGVFSAVIAWFITQLIFRFLNRARNRSALCAMILDFDIGDVLPFRLPKKGKKAESAAPEKPERGAKSGDEDVKTYPARRRTAPAASFTDRDESVKIAAPARRTERVRTASPAAAPAEEAEPAAPARRIASARPAAPSRAAGRHALPEKDAGKKAARRLPGGYQGKH